MLFQRFLETLQTTVFYNTIKRSLLFLKFKFYVYFRIKFYVLTLLKRDSYEESIQNS